LRDFGVALDAKGFVQTGFDLAPGKSRTNNRADARLPLESSIRGVFAVGDVRSGSVKRFGAVIGEGAAVVTELHSLLAQSSAAQSPASGDEKNLSVMVAAEDGCSAGGRRSASAFLNPVVRGERPRTASS
jgi:thioredoxin reductase